MHLSNLTAAAVALLAAYLPAVEARDIKADASAGHLTMGTDGPADTATLGYKFNHIGLNVNDLDAAMHFYGKVLGMRHIFTYAASPILDIVYLGSSSGGKNGTGFQTAEELYKQQHNMQGLVELLYRKPAGNASVPAAEPLQASTRTTNTFCHVGLVVPDIRAAEKRMRAFEVPILKRVGVEMPIKGPIASAFGVGDVSEAEGEEIVAGLDAIAAAFALLVEDPDGNLVEIWEQR